MFDEHGKMKAQLSACLDGELSGDQARQLEQALRADPELAAELEALRAVQSMTRRLPRASAPAGLTGEVLAALARARGSGARLAARRPASWWVGRLATAAVVLLAVGAGVAFVLKLVSPSGNGPEVLVGTASPADGMVGAGSTGRESGPGVPTGTGERGVEAGNEEAVVFYMNVPDIRRGQEELGQVFASNCIQLERPTGSSSEKVLGKGGAEDQFANVRIEYVITVDQEHLQRIVGQLNALRDKQGVSQFPAYEGGRNMELAGKDNGNKAGLNKDMMKDRPPARAPMGFSEPRPPTPAEATHQPATMPAKSSVARTSNQENTFRAGVGPTTAPATRVEGTDVTQASQIVTNRNWPATQPAQVAIRRLEGRQLAQEPRAANVAPTTPGAGQYIFDKTQPGQQRLNVATANSLRQLVIVLNEVQLSSE